MKWKMIVSMLLAMAMLAGCSAKSVANEAPMESASNAVLDKLTDGYYAESDMSYGAGGQTTGSVQGSAGVTAQKLIRTMNLEVETDDMNALLGPLEGKIKAMGGYIESRNVRNGSSNISRRYRYANLTIRVPVDRLDEMTEHIQGQTNVVSINESAEDITLTYVATQSRVKALEVEQERLMELLAKANNMSDLLQIEERLTSVRTELEKVASQLRLYDNLVDYGTLHLSITEVQEFTVVEEKTVWQKIGSGLSDNWKTLCQGAENVFVFLVTSLPFLIPLALAGGVTVLVVYLANRKKPKKAPKTEEET